MKNFINKAAEFILKNAKYIALLILLLILFLLNVDKQNRLNEILINKDIIGTYLMGDEMSKDAEYFVFDRNNNYYRYKQSDFIEKGKYEEVQDNVYVLKNELKEYVIHNNAEIYFLNLKQNDVHLYSKIADNSLFINIPDINK